VDLKDLGRELAGDRRDERNLEGPGGDHDLVGHDVPLVEFEDEPAVT